MFDFFSQIIQLFVTEYIYIIPENISFVKGTNSEVAYPSLRVGKKAGNKQES
jgi:hypothetical protein